MTDELLNKINTVSNRFGPRPVETYEGLASTFIPNPGCNKEDLFKCNTYFNNRLPKDYLLFLNIFNGATFFKIDDIGGLKFLGCDELVKENKFQKENSGSDWDDRIIIICICLGAGDYVGLKVIGDSLYEIIDCFGEEVPANWKPIGTSFDGFLERILDEKGRKFYLDQPL